MHTHTHTNTHTHTHTHTYTHTHTHLQLHMQRLDDFEVDAHDAGARHLQVSAVRK